MLSGLSRQVTLLSLGVLNSLTRSLTLVVGSSPRSWNLYQHSLFANFWAELGTLRSCCDMVVVALVTGYCVTRECSTVAAPRHPLKACALCRFSRCGDGRPGPCFRPHEWHRPRPWPQPLKSQRKHARHPREPTSHPAFPWYSHLRMSPLSQTMRSRHDSSCLRHTAGHSSLLLWLQCFPSALKVLVSTVLSANAVCKSAYHPLP